MNTFNRVFFSKSYDAASKLAAGTNVVLARKELQDCSEIHGFISTDAGGTVKIYQGIKPGDANDKYDIVDSITIVPNPGMADGGGQKLGPYPVRLSGFIKVVVENSGSETPNCNLSIIGRA